MSKEKRDLLDILLDNENEDPILLVNAQGEKMAFEQIALLSLIDETEQLYCLLKPITEIPHVESDEVLIFRVVTGEDGTTLQIEENEETARAVFEMYLELTDGE